MISSNSVVCEAPLCVYMGTRPQEWVLELGPGVKSPGVLRISSGDCGSHRHFIGVRLFRLHSKSNNDRRCTVLPPQSHWITCVTPHVLYCVVSYCKQWCYSNTQNMVSSVYWVHCTRIRPDQNKLTCMMCVITFSYCFYICISTPSLFLSPPLYPSTPLYFQVTTYF